MEDPGLLVSPLIFHPDYARVIGLISIEIGALEMRLGEMLGAIMGISLSTSQIIYMTPRSYIGRLEILENVTKHVMKPDGEGTKKIFEFVKRAKARIQYRNDAMHSLWGVLESDRNIVTRHQVPLLENRPPIKVPLIELQEELSKLRLLINELVAEVVHITRDREATVSRLREERQQGLPARRIKGDLKPP